MIQNEVTEIKKIMTKNDCCIHGLAGCYVDANKEMHILEQGKFLVLQEEEQHKYFDLIKKGLSGRIGKNLLNLVFRTENGVAVPNRDTLMQVLNSELKEPQVLLRRSAIRMHMWIIIILCLCMVSTMYRERPRTESRWRMHPMSCTSST